MDKFFLSRLAYSLMTLILICGSCDYDDRPPFTGSTWINDIGTMWATAGSRLIFDGGSPVKECGFCWNTSGNPAKDDFSCIAEMDGEYFSARLADLEGGTIYYVRSYAINREGIFYGETKKFNTVAYSLPSISSPNVFRITHNSATCISGMIAADNTYKILDRGVCWSIKKDPTINDSKAGLGGGFGNFGCNIEGLQPGTVYYLRAYATNVVGTSYGGNLAIRTYDGSVTDVEGNYYPTVRIGTQEWMAEDLLTKHFSNGDLIETTFPLTLSIGQLQTPVLQWIIRGQEDMTGLYNSYDRVYTWFAATDSRKLCPAGWHLPSRNEWNTLIDHLGGVELTSGTLRWSTNYYWDSPINAGNNEGSFCAGLMGYRTESGQMLSSSYGTYWWTSTESSGLDADAIYCGQSGSEKVTSRPGSKKNGFSVRCVKD